MPGDTTTSQVQDDLLKLAKYFKDRYGGIEQARGQFESHLSLDYNAFEAALKSWRVNVDDSSELFDHIDLDWSGNITYDELFGALARPMEDMKKREEVRVKREVTRILEDLSERIRREYSTIEGLFEKQDFLHKDDDGGGISLAMFGRIAKLLNMDLTPQQRARAFQSIDESNNGTVSKDELEQALKYYMVHELLVDIANFLSCHEETGLIEEAFKKTGDLAKASTETMEENLFLRLLRNMKVLPDNLNEESAKFLYHSLRVKSIEDFKGMLEKVYSEDKVQKQFERERSEQQKKQEKLKEKKAQDATEKEAQADIEKWCKDVREGKRLSADEVTRKWELAARSGKCNMQLEDCIRRLQKEVTDRDQELANDRKMVAEVPDWTDTSPVTPQPTLSRQATPGGGRQSHLDATLLKKDSTRRAQELIQAAASGDVAAVERLVGRGSVNVVGWGGVTPIMAAARHGRIPMLRCLCERASAAEIRQTDNYGRTALDHALRNPAARDWLRGQGCLTGSELRSEAEMLANKLLDIQVEWEKLEGSRRLHRRISNRASLQGRGGMTSPAMSPSPDISLANTPRPFDGTQDSEATKAKALLEFQRKYDSLLTNTLREGSEATREKGTLSFTPSFNLPAVDVLTGPPRPPRMPIPFSNFSR